MTSKGQSVNGISPGNRGRLMSPYEGMCAIGRIESGQGVANHGGLSSCPTGCVECGDEVVAAVVMLLARLA